MTTDLGLAPRLRASGAITLLHLCADNFNCTLRSFVVTLMALVTSVARSRNECPRLQHHSHSRLGNKARPPSVWYLTSLWSARLLKRYRTAGSAIGKPCVAPDTETDVFHKLLIFVIIFRNRTLVQKLKMLFVGV